MTRHLLLSSFAALAALMAATVALLMLVRAGAQGSALPNRATLPMLASDSVEPGVGGGVPLDPSYCAFPPNPQAPPEGAFLGLVTIGGAPAPSGTVVQIYFDGKAGPWATTVTENGKSGYRLIYDISSGTCANKVGASVSFRVNGTLVTTSKSVQRDAIRHDIAVP